MAAKNEIEIVVNGQDNFTKNFTAKLDAIGAKMQKIGLGLTAAVTAPLVALGTKAVMAASDLAESANKVNVVFGEAAGSIQKFADTAATDLGMSEQAALEAAGTFGNLFTSMGLGVETSADMSTNLLTLAADLASFNNIDPAVALEKLRAGLVGEVEPLRTLGVNLSAAAVEAKALEMGLIAEGEEMTAAAKAQAAYALILEQTTNAQGDFKRTSEGLANQTRILKARFADTAAQIGQFLLPVALKLITGVSNLVSWFQTLSPEAQKIIVVIAGIAAAIGPLLVVIGSLLGAISTISTFLAGPLAASIGAALTAAAPVIGVILAIVAVLVVLYLAWKNNWGGIQEKTKAATEWIKNTVNTFLATIKAFWNQYGDGIIAAGQRIWDTIKLVFAAFKAAFEGDWRGFGENLRAAWENVWTVIKNTVVMAWNYIKTVDWGAVGTAIIQGIANGIKAAAGFLADAAKQAAQAALEAAKGFLGIDSPSKVFAEVGNNMMLGMAQGITNGARLPAAASAGAAAGAVSTTNSFVMNMTSNAPTSTLLRDFELMRSMA